MAQKCLRYFIYKKYLEIKQRSRSNILKICLIVPNANSSFVFDEVCLYLADLLLMVCR